MKSNEAMSNPEHIDHLVYHSRRPQAGCQECQTAQENRRAHTYSRAHTYYCSGSGLIVRGELERQTGNGAWAKTHCPECNRKVGATRPTKMAPWVLVGSHKR